MIVISSDILHRARYSTASVSATKLAQARSKVLEKDSSSKDIIIYLVYDPPTIGFCVDVFEAYPDIFQNQYAMPDSILIHRYPAGSAPDSRKTIPWDELSSEVKMLVKRASNGSLEALQILVAWMELNKFTARQDRLVPILYRHLEKDPPSHFNSKSTILEAKFAAASLEGVAQSFLWQLSIPAISTSQTLQHFTRFWSNIWKWINALYLRIYSNGLFHDIDTPLGTGTDEYRTVMAIRRLIMIFTSDSLDLWPRLLETPGFVPLLADVWARLSETPSGSVYAPDTWYTLTISFFHVITEHHGTPIIVDALNGDVSRLATLILKNLRAMTYDVEPTDEYLRGVLPLLTFISTTSIYIPKLGTALLAQHSMIEVMRTLAVHANRSHTEAEMQDPMHGYLIRSCVWSCLVYVQATAKITDGYTWLTQAVRSQVIQSTLKAAAIPSPSTNLSGLTPGQIRCINIITPAKLEKELIDTTQILLMFLIYRSYIKELERVMEDPVIPLLESRVPKDGEFWTNWRQFKAVLRSRVAVKHAFDRIGKYNLPCSAPDCKNHETNKYFKLCGACQTTPYCSKACQASDWKFGDHKSYCYKLRKDREEGGSTPISEHDRQFIQFSADYHVKQYAMKIFQVQDQVLWENNSEDLVVYIEYHNPTVVIFVDIPEAFPEFVRRPILSQRHLLKNTGFPEIYLVVSVPFGKSRQIFILGADMADSPDLWIRKVLDDARANYDESMEDDWDDMIIFRANYLSVPPPLPFDKSQGFPQLEGLPQLEGTLRIFNCRFDNPSMPHA
ncbi:hypothetical protein C0995_000990 [Termitomyces sp. Mi166|nr:hypothetical protein C0995_000990 [Termitomyces sp. Mi166\